MKRKLSILLLIVLLSALLLVPVQAEEQLSYVTDDAGLLTYDEWIELEELCDAVSTKYQCGVYIVTVDDFTEFGSDDVFEVTYDIYHEYTLGKGEERNGLILLLSMYERDYALFVYGDDAEYAFNMTGQIMLEEEFLPYFGENDWFGGFEAYVSACRDYLALAAVGEPVRGNPIYLILPAVGVSFIIALIICLILRAGMKSVHTKSDADSYVSGALALTQKRDQYTHTTETRRKIESSSGSGSSISRSGGGGSGRSGKF